MSVVCLRGNQFQNRIAGFVAGSCFPTLLWL